MFGADAHLFTIVLHGCHFTFGFLFFRGWLVSGRGGGRCRRSRSRRSRSRGRSSSSVQLALQESVFFSAFFAVQMSFQSFGALTIHVAHFAHVGISMLPTTVTQPFALLVLPIGSEAIFLGHGVCCCSCRRPKVGRVEVVWRQVTNGGVVVSRLGGKRRGQLWMDVTD